MARIKSREQKPVPGVDYSEIRIYDEKNLGTGTFTTVLLPDAMAKKNPIISTITNIPVFQMIVNIDSEVSEVTVLLGKADNSPALCRKIFSMPKDLDMHGLHNLKVTFKEWDIKDLKMNGNKLEIIG